MLAVCHLSDRIVASNRYVACFLLFHVEPRLCGWRRDMHSDLPLNLESQNVLALAIFVCDHRCRLESILRLRWRLRLPICRAKMVFPSDLLKLLVLAALGAGSLHGASGSMSGTVATCVASDGDQSVGIQAVQDGTCAFGGLGCYNTNCRFCKSSDTPQSAHLLTCASFGNSFTPSTTTTVTTGSCSVSDGDLAAGIGAITDVSCVRGGLGCYNDHCRYCRAAVTPQSAHLSDCSTYQRTMAAATTPTAAIVSPATAVPATTAPAVAVTNTPSTATQVVQTTAPTPAPPACIAGNDFEAVGFDVVVDPTVSATDIDFYTTNCRLCEIQKPTAPSPFSLCSSFRAYTGTTTTSTDAVSAAAARAAPALQVQATGDNSGKTSFSAAMEKLIEEGKASAISVAAAGCVGLIAVAIVVVVIATRVRRRLRRGSSDSSIGSDDENGADDADEVDVEEGCAASAITEVDAGEADDDATVEV